MIAGLTVLRLVDVKETVNGGVLPSQADRSILRNSTTSKMNTTARNPSGFSKDGCPMHVAMSQQ
jgi:hypothetical protein